MKKKIVHEIAHERGAILLCIKPRFTNIVPHIIHFHDLEMLSVVLKLVRYSNSVSHIHVIHLFFSALNGHDMNEYGMHLNQKE